MFQLNYTVKLSSIFWFCMYVQLNYTVKFLVFSISGFVGMFQLNYTVKFSSIFWFCMYVSAQLHCKVV